MSHYQKLIFLLSKVNPEKCLLMAFLITILLGGNDIPPGGR